MTRFQLLALLTRMRRTATLQEILSHPNAPKPPHWWSRSAREAVRTQLSRLARYGLVSRKFERGGRNSRGNLGVYVYQITPRGIARLKWFITGTSEGGPRAGTPPGLTPQARPESY